MSDNMGRDIRTDRTVYDAGPSGTAVTGLIIALIALAVGLYAAFAPRQVVREVSQTVMEPIERATTGQETAKQPQQATQQAQQQETKTGEELRQEISKLKQELSELRSQVVSGLETNKPKPAARPTNTKPKPNE